MKQVKLLCQGFRSHRLAAGALVTALVGSLALSGALLAQAAQPAPTRVAGKVAVIDVQKILTDSNEGKQALEVLKKLSEGKMKEARSKQVDITDLRSR
ncbi:MAG TPA: OmpH family outer membrane protein, partial [Desulfuromonadales bacterium]|nr:OmpH family outer membrane protein [Desulfuromonadales bacterium]